MSEQSRVSARLTCMHADGTSAMLLRLEPEGTLCRSCRGVAPRIEFKDQHGIWAMLCQKQQPPAAKMLDCLLLLPQNASMAANVWNISATQLQLSMPDRPCQLALQCSTLPDLQPETVVSTNSPQSNPVPVALACSWRLSNKARTGHQALESQTLQKVISCVGNMLAAHSGFLQLPR